MGKIRKQDESRNTRCTLRTCTNHRQYECTRATRESPSIPRLCDTLQVDIQLRGTHLSMTSAGSSFWRNPFHNVCMYIGPGCKARTGTRVDGMEPGIKGRSMCIESLRFTWLILAWINHTDGFRSVDQSSTIIMTGSRPFELIGADRNSTAISRRPFVIAKSYENAMTPRRIFSKENHERTRCSRYIV